MSGNRYELPADPVDAYLTTALFSSSDDDGTELLRNYDLSDISPDFRADAERDVAAFLGRLGIIADGHDRAQLASDFWYDRNRHGTGASDRGYDPEIGRTLTTHARAFGEVYVYIGDDGIVHCS